MTDVVSAIGLLGTALGIVSFFQSNIAGGAAPQGPVIRVKAGGPRNDDDVSLGGKIAATYGWSSQNDYLGQSDSGSMGNAGFSDFIVDSYEPGTVAAYVGVASDDDGVCIAWITDKQLDDTAGGAWTGDIGKQCGQVVYYQAEHAGRLPDGGDYYPWCTWIDKDHSEDVTTAALKFNVFAYGEHVTDTLTNDKACASTLWGPDSGPIPGQPAKRSYNKPRKAWMENQLIVSTIDSHQAMELCNTENSWGPDFVGSDGYFCDMGTHTALPLCSTKDIDGCVNVEDENKAVVKRSIGPKRAVNEAFKQYTKITNWSA
ncbi:hypothetical protein ONS95_000727 [Cadophora gregata]|uniref:uncharacterized protein n=1 Tax=Cadophora gregata TaxID=51156 RepID=UPI0026DD0C85|nr:uncharacterized protein ONS95_000727 [Cadophora gregata]KAK0128776.1 hypothetical protein ONS95_000727 [Cadophora gregata]